MKILTRVLLLGTVLIIAFILSACFLLKPQAPTNLKAITLSASSIKLSWNGSGDFIIYRSKSNVGAAFNSIATTTFNDFVDTALTPSTTYYYKVRAKNDFGLSDPSNTASATTKATPTNSIVIFPDPVLNSIIRAQIGKPAGDIYESDLTTIATISNNWPSSAASKIANLEGVQYCVNLKSLEIINNNVSDVSMLASLTHLQDLNIWSNNVSDISPIQNLTNIKKLYLDYDPIPKSNWAFLKNWTWLEELGMGGMGLTNSDITFLSNFSNLTWLQIFNNSNIDDLSPIASLTNLEVLLINGNKITDLSPLSKLVNLRDLNVGDNPATDLTSLRNLTSLKILAIFGNHLTDISPLASLTNLETLAIEHNNVSNILPLEGLNNLKRLNLSYNQIDDISPLVRNVGINNGDYLDVRWNLLDLTPPSTDLNDIQTLQGRGVQVLYDPQR